MLEDSDTMINLPDGFDARIFLFIQLCSHGIRLEPAINLVSTKNASHAPRKMEVASKRLWGRKFSLKEADIISKSSSTKDSCSKLVFADLMLTWKEHFPIL